jgi:hypothetical protein
VSCKAKSIDELDRIIPVNPPIVNNIIKPQAQDRDGGIVEKLAPDKVLNHLNTFTPVGTAIIIVAEVK